jgi:hypothetical protein
MRAALDVSEGDHAALESATRVVVGVMDKWPSSPWQFVKG